MWIVHDLLGTRCDPCVNQMLSGEPFDYHCHFDLTRAVRPWHLTGFGMHNVLNVFFHLHRTQCRRPSPS